MSEFYGYLNLESTKTTDRALQNRVKFYGYLNLESTKTTILAWQIVFCFTVT